ncbi:MAG: FtsW/RodA/SpoVE family cell cycle protein [Candidatus Neomarinimicrobiota bacterium]
MQNKRKSIEFKEFSFGLFGIAFCLVFISLIGLYSISQNSSGNIFSSPFYKQILILIPSFIISIMLLYIPKYSIHKYVYHAYFFGIIFVLLPFLNPKYAGTHRWFDLGLPFMIQPSEFAKVFTVLALARYLSDHNLRMQKFQSIILPIILALIPTIIVMNQPDLGTSIVILAPILPMLYWSGANSFYLFLILAPILSMLTVFHTLAFTLWAMILAIVIILSRSKLSFSIIMFFGNIFLGLLSPVFWGMLSNYQQNRIITFFNPEKDPLGAAYQIIQSKTAIGSGGLFGKGWGEGTQTHLKFLPVQESDFILSVLSEELGFFCIFFILIMVGILINKIIKNSFLSKDRFSSLALIGFATIFLSHVFVNTAMTVGLIPVKGLPFPFISAGGSFLLSSFVMLGLCINLSANYSD